MNVSEFAGKIKAKYPQYGHLSDQDLTQKVLAKYPQYQSQVQMTPMQDTVNSQWNNPLGAITDFFAPAIKSNERVIANTFDYQNQLPNTTGDLGGSIKRAAQSTGNLVTQLPGAAINDALTILGAKGLKSLVTNPVDSLKAVGSTAKAVVNPWGTLKNFAGGQIEKQAIRAGEVPADVLENKFGTFRTPNPSLSEGTGSLESIAKKGGAKDILRREIMQQGRSPGGNIPQPTYKDILNARKGAYREAYDNLAPAAQRGLKKNIGKAYKEILHEGVPAMKKWDNIYSTMAKLEGHAPGILKILGIGGGSLLGYNVLKDLLGGSSNR